MNMKQILFVVIFVIAVIVMTNMSIGINSTSTTVGNDIFTDVSKSSNDNKKKKESILRFPKYKELEDFKFYYRQDKKRITVFAVDKKNNIVYPKDYTGYINPNSNNLITNGMLINLNDYDIQEIRRAVNYVAHKVVKVSKLTKVIEGEL